MHLGRVSTGLLLILPVLFTRVQSIQSLLSEELVTKATPMHNQFLIFVLFFGFVKIIRFPGAIFHVCHTSAHVTKLIPVHLAQFCVEYVMVSVRHVIVANSIAR